MYFFGRLYFGPYGVLPLQIFTRARDWPRLDSAHLNWDRVPPPKKNNRENLNLVLNAASEHITSGLVTVRIFSPNFSRPRDELWSTYWPTRSASYTVIWHKSIHHVFLFRVIRTTSRHTGVLSCVVLKRRLEFGTTEEMLPSYLDEHMWRKRCGQTANDTLPLA